MNYKNHTSEPPVCACAWCDHYATFEGYCARCYTFCLDVPPDIDEPQLMRVAHKSFVNLYNWKLHRVRQRRSDRLLAESEMMNDEFRAIFSAV